MTPWQKGKRHESWASNPNIAIYIFVALLALWTASQIWAGVGGPQSPDILDKMVMTSLGVAITTKSVESGRQRKILEDKVDEQERKVDALETVAAEEHPKKVKEHTPPLKKEAREKDE